jgi:hypothetical protein
MEQNTDPESSMRPPLRQQTSPPNFIATGPSQAFHPLPMEQNTNTDPESSMRLLRQQTSPPNFIGGFAWNL